MRRFEAFRRWAELLDASFGIPGTSIRFGLDAIVGLVPGFGDVFAGLFSVALVFQAVHFGVPKVVLVRMVFNVLVDVVVGAIPVLGDLFDIGWKANLRNVALLDRFVRLGERRPSRGDYLFVAILSAVLVLATALPLLLLALLLRWLGRPLV